MSGVRLVPLRCVAWLAIAVSAVGCANYQGTARSAEPVALAQEGDWVMVSGLPAVRQEKSKDCGSAALASVLKFWGRGVTPSSIETAIGRGNERLRAGDMAKYAQKQGLRAYVFFGTIDDVVYELEQGRPVIVGVGKMYDGSKAISHYEVVVGFEREKKRVLLFDPARGFQVDSLGGFAEEWKRSKGVTIVVFEPNDQVSQK
jgi:ABC-type bacteriocin/lantibiotic exporter with double-glycine peptidase domain